MKSTHGLIAAILLPLLAACVAAPASPMSIAGTRWQLQSADRGVLATKAAGSGVTLEFSADRATGHGGCNRYTGSYTLGGETLQLGPVAATKRGCMGDANAIESAWLALLASPLTIESSGERLTLLAGDGTRLVFGAAPAAP